MKYLNIKTIAAAIVGSAIALGATYATRTQAQNTINPLTGSCGGVFNVGSMFDILWHFASDSIDSEGINLMLSMNFDTKKADVSIGTFNVTNKAGAESRFGLNSPVNFETQEKSRDVDIYTQINFDYKAVNGIASAYEVTLDFLGDEKPRFLMLPVNGGNTFLIQGRTFGASGVCQKM